MISRFLLIICFSLGLANQTMASCPYEIGQTVVPIPVKQAYKRLRTFEMIKDEYETNAEFERRKEAVSKRLPPLLIAGQNVPPGLMSYDADNRRLRIGEGFAGTTISAIKLPNHLKLYSGAVDTEHDISFEINRYKYSSFDFRLYEYHVDRNVSWTRWEMDEIEGLPDQPQWKRIESAYLYMEPATAKALRKDLRVGFYVTPKSPFVYSDTKSVKYGQKIIFADIHCAILTDSNGTVLKTINPNRSGIMRTNPAPFSQPLEPYLNRRAVVAATPDMVTETTQAPATIEETLPTQQSDGEVTEAVPSVVAIAEPEIPTPRVKPSPPPKELPRCKSEDPDKYCTGGHF